MLDWEDRYRIDAIGVYSGWHATLLHAPRADLLPELTGDPVAALPALRAGFAAISGETINRAYRSRHDTDRRPPA